MSYIDKEILTGITFGSIGTVTIMYFLRKMGHTNMGYSRNKNISINEIKDGDTVRVKYPGRMLVTVSHITPRESGMGFIFWGKGKYVDYGRWFSSDDIHTYLGTIDNEIYSRVKK